MVILSESSSHCHRICPSAVEKILAQYPEYLKGRVATFFASLNQFKDDIDGYENFPTQELYVRIKFQKVYELLANIKGRTERILKESND